MDKIVPKGETLDQWGERCLSRKKARMTNLLKIANPDEALYREIMLALGYRNNKVQFLELATITPYSEIKTLKDREQIRKTLLFRGGFSEDKDGFPEDFDFSLKMESAVWSYRGTRPANFPEKRIRQFALFLEESCRAGGIEGIFRKRIIENYATQLNKNQAIKTAQAIGSINGIGKQRALEILFNIILPFFLVLFEEEGKRQYLDFIERLYEVHPALEDNSRTKAMKAKLLGNPPIPPLAKGGEGGLIYKVGVGGLKINSVKQYMGLLELYNKDIGGGGQDDS